MADKLDTLISLVKKARAIHTELPVQDMHALLYIARHPGCTTTKLWQELEMTSGTGTRITSRLGEWARYKVPGLGLVLAEANPKDRRERQLWLTPAGQRAVKSLTESI